MKDPLKPRDKITQKMTRDGAITENQTTGETERISKRTQDAELQKTPEQQAAQDAAQLQGAASPTSPLPHVPGAAPKADTGKTERVMEHIDAAHTRKASKKAARKAQEETAAQTKSSRLQFTEEELSTPELEKYIEKSNRAADRLDAAKAAIPKQKKLVKERTFDEATGKAKTRLRFEEREKPMPGSKSHKNPLSRPAQEAGIFVHNKIHSVEKDNSGVEGAHKSEELAERGAKYGARKVKEGYHSHKLKPYRAAAKAEKAAFKANVDFQYHKALHDNPQIAGNPLSRFMQKQQIKRQYAKSARKGGAKTAQKAAENTRKAAKKTAEETKKAIAFVGRHPAGVCIAVAALLLFIMVSAGLSSCGSMFSGKTEELIRRLKRAKFAKQRVEIFKPAIDTRYSEADVVSHDSHSIASTPIDSSASILLFTSEIDVVGIDEAQFFDSGLIDVCNLLANNGIRVIVAGLDMDFRGIPFGPMPGLCAIADEVSKVHAICVKCGQLASFSHRTVKNDKQVLLGETEEYEPLCRECYQQAIQADQKESGH